VIARALLALFAQAGAATGAAPSGRSEPPCACPCPSAAPGAPGSPDPFRAPAAAAFTLNREGRDLYRARQWEAARAKYRAALKADPQFEGPRLNLACAYAQQGQFPEAVREAVTLAERAYVPWAREILEAADLAPLRTQKEMTSLRQALARAGAQWGQRLAGGLLFVARTRPPVRLPAKGVLYLGLNQEVFAWLPATGRYWQVTAEDGRVLALARSADHRKMVYVVAGKLVREPGRPHALRALGLRMLDLSTMALGKLVPIEGDVTRLDLAFPAHAAAALIRVARAGQGVQTYRFAGQSLEPIPDHIRQSDNPTVLTGRGVVGGRSQTTSPPCAFAARAIHPRGEPPAIAITPRRGRPFRLLGPHGAGLLGLPFPE
jgi:hypothetical protein